MNTANRSTFKHLNDKQSIEEEYIHNMQQQIYLMEQENKLLKEREKERTELMNLDLNDNDHMIYHIDHMREKYLKMKNTNEANLKNLETKVIDLQKEKKSLSNKNSKLKAHQDELQKDANKYAGEMERNKEIRRRDIETLRKELDTQQRKAKQSTIEQTECRNELLELMQAFVKCNMDLSELTREKEERTQKLNDLHNKLVTEHNLFSSDIAQLKDSIFGSEEQLEIESNVKKLETEREQLIMLEAYTKAHLDTLNQQKKDLEATNESLSLENVRMKEEIEFKEKDLAEKEVQFNKQFDKEVKSLSNTDLINAKERRQIRTNRNNELEEMWNIKKIEMRKQRDKHYNENEEKKELQHQHGKLDEAQKDQAQDISNFKHRITELNMGIEEKADSIDS